MRDKTKDTPNQQKLLSWIRFLGVSSVFILGGALAFVMLYITMALIQPNNIAWGFVFMGVTPGVIFGLTVEVFVAAIFAILMSQYILKSKLKGWQAFWGWVASIFAAMYVVAAGLCYAALKFLF